MILRRRRLQAALVGAFGLLVECPGAADLPPVPSKDALDGWGAPNSAPTPPPLPPEIREMLQDPAAFNARQLAQLYRALDNPTAFDEGRMHDACLSLVQGGGDKNSVPHLIAALRSFGDVEPGPRDGIICTQEHCVRALERITGAKVGYSYSSWKRWYERHGTAQKDRSAPSAVVR